MFMQDGLTCKLKKLFQHNLFSILGILVGFNDLLFQKLILNYWQLI